MQLDLAGGRACQSQRTREGNSTTIWVQDGVIVVRRIEVRMIEDVEKLHSKLSLEIFGNLHHGNALDQPSHDLMIRGWQPLFVAGQQGPTAEHCVQQRSASITFTQNNILTGLLTRFHSICSSKTTVVKK
jgi:hypothetical protein